MILMRYLFCIFAITFFTDAVKVNMHGSLSLGKDVMDTISHYLRSRYNPQLFNGRRSLNSNFDPISPEVKAASLCTNLQFCKGNMEQFVNEYVTALAETVIRIFDGILNPGGGTSGIGKPFFSKLKFLLIDSRKILKAANEKVDENHEAHLWVGVVKRISAKFQRKTIIFIVDNLEADQKEIEEIKKRITQSLVIDIALAEAKALSGLCSEFQICDNSNKCTLALNALLGQLRKLPSDKIKAFVKAFYDALNDTFFYSRLSTKTAKEFQNILNNMSFSDSVPTKEILNSIQEAIETRLNAMHSSMDLAKGQDVQLVHIILSDMDYLYSNKHKTDPFRNILDDFIEWAKVGGKVDSYMMEAVKNIERTLTKASDQLVNKLINEVRVFLEITVDPDQ